MPFDRLRTGFETLLTELLSTNGFSVRYSVRYNDIPFALRRRGAPSRSAAAFFNGLLSPGWRHPPNLVKRTAATFRTSIVPAQNAGSA